MPRVRVFIDGQNLYKGVSRMHRARVHPVLLARELAGSRKLVRTDYYSGIHDKDENRSMFELVSRRHDLVRDTGVRVTERTLRYHWEWKVDDKLPPPWDDKSPKRATAKVKRYRGAREKGIDVALALDAVTAAFTDSCDVVIIVSRDRDLMEIANEINQRSETRPVQVEVAFVQERRGEPIELADYDGRQLIDAEMVKRCADTFDYSEPLPQADKKKFLADVGVETS